MLNLLPQKDNLNNKRQRN